MTGTAARTLLELRRAGRTAQPIAEIAFAAAYEAQREVAEALGETVGGWKVAISPDGVPIAAPLLASTIHDGGCRLNLPHDKPVKIETEIALRLSRDLPPRDVPYTRDDVIGAIASVGSAFEIVIPRAGEPPETPFGFYLADYLGNGATVVGAPTRWTPPDQGCTAELWLDGAHTATGRHPHLDPLASLLAYANRQVDRMGGLRAGQVVITGSFTKPLLLGRARSARGQVAHLPAVEIEILP